LEKKIFQERRRFLKQGIALGSGAMVLGAGGTLEAQEIARQYVIPAPGVHSIEVAGTEARFPVRRIYCLGRNYSAHAIEMGDDPDKSPPFYFMKPTDAICPASEDFSYPLMTERLGYEVELLVALKSGGISISAKDASRHIFGYGVGLDMTRRDIQDIAKETRRPWEGGKSFDRSAPCSPLQPISKTGFLESGRIWLSVNGEVRQDSDISLMRWNIPKTIEILSSYFKLMAGDIILTGTPDGVGLVKRGEVLNAGIEGLGEIDMRIV
jgi:fumarylpyruvate hydrolase